MFKVGDDGYGAGMNGSLSGLLHSAGFRAWHMHAASMGSIGLCIALWVRAKTVDQDERGNAERRALFVGLWPPTFYLLGDSLDRQGRRGLAALRR
jgi:hypothetical protein